MFMKKRGSNQVFKNSRITSIDCLRSGHNSGLSNNPSYYYNQTHTGFRPGPKSQQKKRKNPFLNKKRHMFKPSLVSIIVHLVFIRILPTSPFLNLEKLQRQLCWVIQSFKRNNESHFWLYLKTEVNKGETNLNYFQTIYGA